MEYSGVILIGILIKARAKVESVCGCASSFGLRSSVYEVRTTVTCACLHTNTGRSGVFEAFEVSAVAETIAESMAEMCESTIRELSLGRIGRSESPCPRLDLSVTPS